MDQETAQKSPPQDQRAVSDLLRSVASGLEKPEISIRELLAAFGDRAFGLGIIAFALPNTVPIPVLGALFGLPLIFLAFQMMLGHRQPWLPELMMSRAIARERFVGMVDLVEPKLRKLESLLKPRLTFLFAPVADRLIGLFLILCAISILIPLPGSNFPPAIGAIVVALAVIAQDGIALLIGLLIGILGLGYTTIVVSGLIWAALVALPGWLGL